MFSTALFQRLTIALFLTASLCVISLYLITVPILEADFFRIETARHRSMLDRLENVIRDRVAAATATPSAPETDASPVKTALPMPHPGSSERILQHFETPLKGYADLTGGVLLIMDEQMRLPEIQPGEGVRPFPDYVASESREAVMAALRESHETGFASVTLKWHPPGRSVAQEFREQIAWVRYLDDLGLYLVAAADSGPNSRRAEALAWRISLLFSAVAVVLGCLLARAFGFFLAPVIPLAEMASEFLEEGEVANLRFVAATGELGKIGAAFYKMIDRLETLHEQSAEWHRERRNLIRTRDAARIRAFDLSRAKTRLENRIETFKTEEELLRKSEDRYRAMLENIDECFYEADLLGNLVFFNDALIRMLEYDKKDELVGKNFREIMDQETAKEAFQTFDMAMEKGESFKGLQWRLVRKSGKLCHVEMSVSLIRDKNDEIIGYRGVGRDVSRLVHMVYHDTLTGLLNRKAFFEESEKALRIAKRYKMKAKLLFMDLNQFKLVNDEYGHDVGDEVLKDVATRMLAALRETDMTFRLAGDEFTVILNNMNGEFMPEEVARRIIEQLSMPYYIKDNVIDFISPSIGISGYPGDADTVEELIRCADIAMFEAKERSKKDAVGRNRPGRFTFYDPSLEERFQGNRTWNEGDAE